MLCCSTLNNSHIPKLAREKPLCGYNPDEVDSFMRPEPAASQIGRGEDVTAISKTLYTLQCPSQVVSDICFSLLGIPFSHLAFCKNNGSSRLLRRAWPHKNAGTLLRHIRLFWVLLTKLKQYKFFQGIVSLT